MVVCGGPVEGRAPLAVAVAIHLRPSFQQLPYSCCAPVPSGELKGGLTLRVRRVGVAPVG